MPALAQLGQPRTPLRDAAAAEADPVAWRELALRHVPVTLLAVDRSGQIQYATPSVTDHLGYDARHLVGRSLWTLVHAHDVPAARADFRQAVAHRRVPRRLELRLRGTDNAWHLTEVVVSLIDGTAAEPCGVAMVLRDALSMAAKATLELDAGGHIQWSNDACLLLLGYTASELHGSSFFDLTPRDESENRDPDPSRLLDGSPWRGEIVYRQKDGRRIALDTAAVPFRAPDGDLDHVSLTLQDPSEQRQLEERLQHAALHDPLTGLPNRTLFRDRVTQALSRRRRNGSSFAIFFLDLDRFKDINDTYGHTTGDELLANVGRRLRRVLREPDTVARIGGDEFAVLAGDAVDIAAADHVAARILEAFAPPVQLAASAQQVSVSLGCAMAPADGDTLDVLLQRADMAMYAAKQRGGNVCEFFMPAMQVDANARVDIERGLRLAIERSELSLVYQPIVSSATGNLVAFEALLRWTRPDKTPLAPDVFIPVAEATGLIVPIGTWVLRTACEQARRWHAGGWTDVRVAVNVSAAQLDRPEFSEVVRLALADSGLEADCLELELTERTLVRHSTRLTRALRELKSVGVRLAIDDFGMGWSTLESLKRLPIDIVKIDRSFVSNVVTSQSDAAVVESVMALAQRLGIEAVAEGVESEAQQAFLARHGCSFMQGWLHGRPMAAAAVSRLLEEQAR